ncbi:hypothetical protein F5880DRAFT_1541168 [Lentinula raphanica]|nr:hypothetical protein F5880DRAFT_1541168 [Lentinula raphanica]
MHIVPFAHIVLFLVSFGYSLPLYVTRRDRAPSSQIQARDASVAKIGVCVLKPFKAVPIYQEKLDTQSFDLLVKYISDHNLRITPPTKESLKIEYEPVHGDGKGNELGDMVCYPDDSKKKGSDMVMLKLEVEMVEIPTDSKKSTHK